MEWFSKNLNLQYYLLPFKVKMFIMVVSNWIRGFIFCFNYIKKEDNWLSGRDSGETFMKEWSCLVLLGYVWF